jgi:hypothetical protein
VRISADMGCYRPCSCLARTSPYKWPDSKLTATTKIASSFRSTDVGIARVKPTERIGNGGISFGGGRRGCTRRHRAWIGGGPRFHSSRESLLTWPTAGAILSFIISIASFCRLQSRSGGYTKGGRKSLRARWRRLTRFCCGGDPIDLRGR